MISLAAEDFARRPENLRPRLLPVTGRVSHQPIPIEYLEHFRFGSQYYGAGSVILTSRPSGQEPSWPKRKRRAIENAYHSMPFACYSGLLQATSPDIVCILHGDQFRRVVLAWMPMQKKKPNKISHTHKDE